MTAAARWLGLSVVVVIAIVAGGTIANRPSRPPVGLLPAGGLVAVAVEAYPSLRTEPCTDTFVPHELDARTDVSDAITMFDSNGSGVAVGDLDADGRLDLVFANLDGPDSILWNQGGLRFERAELADFSSRAVNTVDVDGDGRLDIVFTHRAGGVSLWRNAGSPEDPRRFEPGELPGIQARAYSMTWNDLNGDGRLDLVTGSYDAESFLELGDTFMFGDGDGIYVYLQGADDFTAERLARTSHALAIALPDIDLDGRRDLYVGNDFNVPDAAWRWTGDAFEAVEPLATTTEDTMSLAEGDINNDGRLELFATDMKPYAVDVHTLASWLPVMDKMPKQKALTDRQVIANVLQVRDATGTYRDQAVARGVSATGWSWSAKFGDLDTDGYLDLYVVNGMIDGQTLGHLEGHELVEENQALRNGGDGTFAPASGWGLAATESGRGMSMADLDDDGDLDIVVNNLASNARLFENRLCTPGSNLQVDLRWADSANSHALGAQLALVTDKGTLRRDVIAGSGYLSGDPSRQHFGIGAEAIVTRLDILWPDGLGTSIDAPAVGQRLVITRGDT